MEKQLPVGHFLGLVSPLACRSCSSVPLMLAIPFGSFYRETTK